MASGHLLTIMEPTIHSIIDPPISYTPACLNNICIKICASMTIAQVDNTLVFKRTLCKEIFHTIKRDLLYQNYSFNIDGWRVITAEQ